MTADVAADPVVDALPDKARRWSLRAFAPVIGIATFLGLWQASTWIFDVKRFILPGPWSIVVHMVDNPG